MQCTCVDRDLRVNIDEPKIEKQTSRTKAAISDVILYLNIMKTLTSGFLRFIVRKRSLPVEQLKIT